MAQAEVRRVVNLVGETNQPDREEVTYQLGAVIDGGWVPFLTKSEGYAQHLSSINAEAPQSDAQATGTASNTEPTSTTTSGTAAPQASGSTTDAQTSGEGTPSETTNQ